MAELTFVAELWEHHGEGAWHFVTVPLEESEEIRLVSGPPRGFGSVRVQVEVGGSAWATSVFPDGSSGCFVLPVKKAVRRAEDLVAGDPVEVTLRVVDAEG